jgi:hypothetical protein
LNLLTFTQEFDNGAWTKSAITITANTTVTTAPDGTSTADKIVATAVAGYHALARSFTFLTGNYAISVYAKASEYTLLRISDINSGEFAASFDLTNGTVSNTGGVRFVSASATSVGSGWYRCVVIVNNVSAFRTPAFVGYPSGATLDAYGAQYTGDAVSGVFLWGTQLEVGSTATTYTRNFGGLFPPRFDYDPVSLVPRGLLIEEQRTNLVTYSEDFTNAAWGKVNFTATGNATTAPDGTTTADKLEVTATGVATVGSRASLTIAGTAAAYTVYVKQGTGATVANTFLLRNETTATNLIGGTLNYSTGVWAYTVGSTGVTVQNAGNGWWRLTLAASSGITAGNAVTIYYGYAGGTSVTAGDHFFIWGAQLEVGAFSTSYIPTVASQVTRSADIPLIQAPNFAPWYNQSEGSFIAEFTPDTTVASNLVRVLVASQVSASARVVDIHAGIGVWQSFNGTTNIVGGAAAVTSVPQKFGAAFKAGDYVACLNGGTVGTATTATVNSPSQLALGYFPSGNVQQLNGHLRRLFFYPTRLTNAQIQALST